MYICDFCRSEGAGSATRRNTRGLTRSVMAFIVPPLPAASRPSKIMIARRPLYFTHSCSLQSSPWSLRNSLVYLFVFILLSWSAFECLFITLSLGGVFLAAVLLLRDCSVNALRRHFSVLPASACSTGASHPPPRARYSWTTEISSLT